jgi:hypothetical protein
MTTIIIILGLTATQIQERSSFRLDVSALYDIDARYFQGPIVARYQTGDRAIDLPEAELVSLSFDMGILTSAHVTPHRRPLNGQETAKLCQELERDFLGQGFAFRKGQAKEFSKFMADLKLGHQHLEPLPPWRFGWRLKDEKVTLAIEPFETSSEGPSATRRYSISLAFGNLALSSSVSNRMNELKRKYFPNRLGRIPLSEYPKE